MKNETIKQYPFKGEKLEIEIKQLDFISRMPSLTGKLHRADFYQLIWVSEGVLNVTVDFEDMVLHAGHLLAVARGQVCKFYRASGCNGYSILFTSDFMAESESDTAFLHRPGILSPLVLKQAVAMDAEIVDQVIGLIMAELNRPSDRYQAAIARNLLRVLLLETDRRTKPTDCEMTNSTVERFCGEVERLFRTIYNVCDYLPLIGMQEKTLTAALKTAIGLTPKAYIDRRRILEAKRLLAYSHRTVKEIGYELNFYDSTNFIKFFRRQTGLTPVEFRQRYRHQMPS